MAFDYRGRKFLVGTSKECRLWLLDRDALGGEDHRTTLHTTPLICNDAQAFDAKGVWGALGAWQDASGTQWVLVPFWGPVSTQFKAPIEHGRPTGGGVAAFKLEQRPGKWQLTPAWLSRDMDLAEEAVIANGVVFAYAAGEDATQVVPDSAWNEPGGPVRRRPQSGPRAAFRTRATPTLYALDGQTGKELWSSGNQIESWNHFSGLTVANGRAYIATFDGTLYCFGVPAAATSESRDDASAHQVITWPSTIAAAAHRLESGARQSDGMADRRRRCAAHVLDPHRRQHLSRHACRSRDSSCSGRRRSKARCGTVSAGRGCDCVGRHYLHAALHHRRSFQPGLCDRQRHRKPVLEAPFRWDARGGHGSVSRRHHRDVDPHGGPHHDHAGFRSRKGRRARKRVVQQRLGEPGAGVPIPGRGGAGRGNVAPPATPPAAPAPAPPAPAASAGLSAAVNTSARSNPNVTVPDERRRTRFRRTVAPIRRRLRSERRRHVPNARVGVG